MSLILCIFICFNFFCKKNEPMLIENTDYREETLDLGSPFDVKLISDFLSGLNFNFYPETVDYSIVIYNLKGDIIGTGSMQKNVLKYVAVAPKYRETAAFPMIVSHLTERIVTKYKTVFVFTNPHNLLVFKGLGFKHIATAEPFFSLLEYGTSTISTYQEKIKAYKKQTKTNKIASVVVNCNPFTNGHKFLIEKAANENELVYLFVVQENLSVFPFDIRWNLIKKGIEHLKNVVMIPGGDYIVSGKTFPQYFLKGIAEQEIVNCQGELDIQIFCKHIAPILNIAKRYVGTETYCKTTAGYNAAMKKLLPQYNMEFIEVDRMKEIIDNGEEYVSASTVRNSIKNNELDKYWHLLPQVTQDFFMSDESKPIQELIKKSDSRH